MASSDGPHLTDQDLTMSQKQHITDVLMVGATGSIGRLAVEAAQRHGLRLRALVRDVRRGERLLPGVELVRGDLEDPASLRNAVEGADAIVLTHGSGGDPETRRRVDYGGVRNLLRALGGAQPRVALMTSIYATRSDIPGNSPWKRRSERLLRVSGLPYTIVRPGWFDQAGPTQRRLVLEQGGTVDGGIARDQIAETLVRSLLTDTALGKTFELIAEEGKEPANWTELFSALKTDESGSVDGVLDPSDLPVDAEPQAVRADLDAFRSSHGTSG
ncbi:SDR family oxidoreductase [Streptomyces sp. SP18BB07]|uniref:SDR family oxidoreductase n=1 Tax=Streptomyces sp. SP18BB07 TaxID=3002522 RepID=UPI002E78810F|nr:SDR family oxidoreductase [Streptomyces sp. SP18BB07]MEE1765214.1 SDR family oxidoreductase [Streptomyces sp. SP18BB07]